MIWFPHLITGATHERFVTRPIAPDETRLFRAVLDGRDTIQGIRHRDLCAALGPTVPPRSRQYRWSIRLQ